MPRRLTSARFIGRGEVLALVDELLTSTRLGQGDVVLVSGEAGVGKTRLIAELTARARGVGFLTLTGWCVEDGDQVMPLAPVIDMVRDLVAGIPGTEPGGVPGSVGRDLAGLIGDFDLGGGPDRRSAPAASERWCEGVLGALRRVSQDRPVVVVVEDLHWADQSTRQLLAFLAPRLMDYPVLLAMTYRSDELHRRHPLRPFLVSLERAVRPEQIELAPFTADELAELVAAVTQTSPDPAFVSTLQDRCGGNAFFAEELLAAGRRTNLPALVRDAVLARVEGVGRTYTSVLRTAAAAGPRIDTAVLAAACGLDASAVDAAAQALTDKGLWVRDGDLRFRHELTREVIQAELPAGDRAAVHASLATALATLQPHRTGDIARHWALAGDQPRALQASVAAGRAAAAVGAAAEAFLQFERALELWDRVPDAAALAQLSLGEVLLEAADAAGRARLFGRAVSLGRRAVARLTDADPAAQALACLRGADWAWFAEADDGAGAFVQRAIELTPPRPPSPTRALALAWQALLLADEGAADAGDRAAEAIDMARACGARRAELHACITVAAHRCLTGDPAGLAQLRAAVESARTLGFPLEVGRAYHSLAGYSQLFGRHTDVLDLEQEALDYCAAAGIGRVYGPMVELNVIRSLQRLGRWTAVEARVSRIDTEFDGQPLEHFTLAGSWGLILVRQGRLDGVADMVADALARLHDHISELGPTATTAVELAAAQGRSTDIPAIIEATLDRILPLHPRGAADLLASALGELANQPARPAPTDTALARRVGSWYTRVHVACTTSLAQGVFPDLGPRLALARTELARLHGDPCTTGWAALIPAWDGLDAHYESSYTRWRLAESILNDHQRRPTAEARAEARTLLTAARRSAGDMGAVPLLDQIDALARRAHLKLDPPPDAPTVHSSSPAADGFGLTDRELEVLHLVSDGYSNGQIGQALYISRKTASVHVSNILRKLGVSNRLQAATIATAGNPVTAQSL